MTNPRDLIKRLADIADALDGRKLLVSDQGQAMDGFTALANFRALADEARAYLAQPEPEGPTDEDIMRLMPQQMHEDLAAAARALAEQVSTISPIATGIMRIMLNRHAVDLARAALARWGK